AGLLGAGTLRDISLSIFVGIIVGTVATLFIQAPLYALFRRNESSLQERDKRILRSRKNRAEDTTEDNIASRDTNYPLCYEYAPSYNLISKLHCNASSWRYYMYRRARQSLM